MAKKRDYKREYEIYHGKKKQIKRRAQRNKSNRAALKAGLRKKGDKMDTHHIDNNPHNQSKSNIAVIHRSRNRSIK